MGGDHGRLHVLMPEEFLHRADVVMHLEEMSGGGCGGRPAEGCRPPAPLHGWPSARDVRGCGGDAQRR